MTLINGPERRRNLLLVIGASPVLSGSSEREGGEALPGQNGKVCMKTKRAGTLLVFLGMSFFSSVTPERPLSSPLTPPPRSASLPSPGRSAQRLISKRDYWETTWVISCRLQNSAPVENRPSLPLCRLAFYALDQKRGQQQWGW